MHHPAVVSVIPRVNHPDQVISNVNQMATEIPVDIWAELKCEGYLREDAPTPQ
jgi:D-threo-aldose 1-dehydrogenase